MSLQENKAIVLHMTEECYNKGNIESAGQFFAGAYVHHDPASPHVTDLAGFKESLRTNLAGCPDLHITIDALLAEGDQVTKRWTLHATHTADLGGLPPTGRRITLSGIDLFRLADGKIVECWLAYDNLSLLQQLGAIPTPEPA
jgi:steroid delta-isomerase-like uncharacterized protein